VLASFGRLPLLMEAIKLARHLQQKRCLRPPNVSVGTLAAQARFFIKENLGHLTPISGEIALPA